MLSLGIDVPFPPQDVRCDTADVPGMVTSSQSRIYRNVNQNSIVDYLGVFHSFPGGPTAEYDSGADSWWTTEFNGLPMHLDPEMQRFPENGMSHGEVEVSGEFPNLQYHVPRLAVDMTTWDSQLLAYPPNPSVSSTSGTDTESWSHGFCPPPPFTDTADAPTCDIQAGGVDFIIQENGIQNFQNHVETGADNEFWMCDPVAGSFGPSGISCSDAFLGWR